MMMKMERKMVTETEPMVIPMAMAMVTGSMIRYHNICIVINT